MTISDGALVAAATLSNRYITGRQLPDKAIDLIDEAASRLRMELDSSPVEIDELRRSVDRLRMEESYLTESDPEGLDEATQDRLSKLRADLADREENLRALIARWEAEKGRATTVSATCASSWIRCVPSWIWRFARGAGRKPVVCRTARSPPLSVRLPRPRLRLRIRKLRAMRSR